MSCPNLFLQYVLFTQYGVWLTTANRSYLQHQSSGVSLFKTSDPIRSCKRYLYPKNSSMAQIVGPKTGESITGHHWSYSPYSQSDRRCKDIDVRALRSWRFNEYENRAINAAQETGAAFREVSGQDMNDPDKERLNQTRPTTKWTCFN